MSTLAKLPYSSFTLTGSGTQGMGRAWQLDVDLEASRPMKFFGLTVFYDGPASNAAAIDEINQRICDTIRYHKQLLQGHRVSVTNDDFFEQSLQKINSEINVFLRDWSEPLPIQSWAMVLAMVTPDDHAERLQFFVSRFGDINAWLLHTAQLDTKKMINIFDTPDPLINSTGPQKFFKNILSSSLSIQDQLIFCTPNIFNYASLTDVKKILTTLSASSAMKQMENHVSEALVDSTAAAVTLRLSPYPLLEKHAPRIQTQSEVQRSMQNLVATESETEKLLGSTVGVNFKRISTSWKRLTEKLQRYSDDKNEAVMPGRGNKSKPSWMKPVVRAASRLLSALGAGVGRIASLAQRKERSAGKTPMGSADLVSTNRTVTKVPVWQTYATSTLSIVGKGTGKLLRSPKAYIAFIVLIALAGGGLYWRSLRMKHAEDVLAAEKGLQEVTKSLDRVDSYLIVGREQEALMLVRQTEEKLAALPDMPEINDGKTASAQKISEQRRRLRKEITVKSPDARIADLPSQLQSAPKELAVSEGNLLVLGDNPRTILSFNRQNGNTQTLSITTDVNSWSEATWLGNNQLIISDGKVITTAAINKGTSTSQPVTGTTTNLGALASYNNRLYTFVAAENQIFRSNTAPNTAVFSPWLKAADPALSKARDIAIDGSIYVLTAENIRQYVQGAAATNLSLDPVEPVLSDAKHLSYTAEGQYFFVLETNRLLVYRKNGKFVAQYLLENGKPMVDFFVDETTKTAYVLTDTDLISFPVQI